MVLLVLLCEAVDTSAMLYELLLYSRRPYHTCIRLLSLELLRRRVGTLAARVRNVCEYCSTAAVSYVTQHAQFHLLQAHPHFLLHTLRSSTAVANLERREKESERVGGKVGAV